MKPVMCSLVLLAYPWILAHGQDDPFANDGQKVGAPRAAAIEDSIAQNVAVVVEYVAVEHTDLTKLLRAHRKAGTDTGLREDVGKLMEAGQATLLEITQMVTRSGQPIQSESVAEIIYPTEYDPAELPQKVEGPIEDPSKLITPATPSAFQVRNTGFTVKALPMLGPSGEIIDLDLVSEVVKHDRDRISGQREAQIAYPLFYTMTVSTNLSAPVGEYMLAGVHTPSEEFHALKEGKSRWMERNVSWSLCEDYPYPRPHPND